MVFVLSEPLVKLISVVKERAGGWLYLRSPVLRDTIDTPLQDVTKALLSKRENAHQSAELNITVYLQSTFDVRELHPVNQSYSKVFMRRFSEGTAGLISQNI